MSTLTVPTTTDFTQTVLDDVSLIDFTNLAGSQAMAFFATEQFAPGPIDFNVTIDGSAGSNDIVVTGNSISAALWTFSHWQANDKVIFKGTSSFDEVIGTVVGDRIFGFADNDFLLGHDGNDLIAGGTGNDLMQGNEGDDTLRGGAGADYLQGDAGSNDLSGGAGDDGILTSTADGGDRIDGGEGFDGVEFLAQGTVDIFIDIRDGGAGRDVGNGTVIINVEQLSFDGFSGSGNHVIIGGAADDEFLGGAGNDRLFGSGGSDFIRGGDGHNVLSGGAGDDVMLSSTADGGDRIRGGAGLDRLSLHRGDSVNYRIDISDGGGGRDIGDGTTLDGVDVLEFFGGDGADWVRGGAGVDRLCGGGGDDVLTGGGGGDIFIFKKALETGTDSIIDFVQGDDVIDLSHIDAKPGLPGNRFTFIGEEAFGQTAGELRYFQSVNATFIQADLTGDGAADLLIELVGVIDLEVGDLIL